MSHISTLSMYANHRLSNHHDFLEVHIFLMDLEEMVVKKHWSLVNEILWVFLQFDKALRHIPLSQLPQIDGIRLPRPQQKNLVILLLVLLFLKLRRLFFASSYNMNPERLQIPKIRKRLLKQVKTYLLEWEVK